MPGSNVFQLSPICPHSVTQRPLVVPADSTFVVKLVRKNPRDNPSAQVALDGQKEVGLKLGDVVHIRKSDKPFRILLPTDRTHFDLLNAKLMWGWR